VASGIVTSIVVQSAEIAAGAAKGCVTAECQAIQARVALDLMPTLFLAGPLVCWIGMLPLIGLERPLNREQIAALRARPALNLRDAYARIFRNTQARIFFFFIVTAIFGLFLQDDILEPFGADVFSLPVSATARFQSIMGSATIVAMLVMGVIASRANITKRAIANMGAVMSACGFALLVASALLHVQPMLYAGIITLGAGMGVFNIGALSMMMDMTVPGETGSLMGAWGMAQALANGWGQLIGGGLRDVGLALTASAPISYSVIFAVSIVMCFVAISLMARVDIQKFKRMTREQMGLAMGEA
jgi:BCD family chlorophyll transporter-like MFS transporter